MIRIVAIAVLLTLAGCAEAPAPDIDLGRVCEEVEPFRPAFRGVVTVIEPAAALPFAITRQISCADLENVADRLHDQK